METEVRTWWVLRGPEKYGPYTRSELKQMAIDGNVIADDKIWKDGLKSPVLASSIKGLIPPAPVEDQPEPAAAPTALVLESIPAYKPATGFHSHFDDEPAHDGEAHATVVDAGSGGGWIGRGWGLIVSAPLQWLLIFGVLVGLGVGVGMVYRISHPLGALAQIIHTLLQPVLMVGVLVVAHDVDTRGSTNPTRLFSGFNERALALVGVGVLNMVFSIALLLIAGLLVISLLGVGLGNLMSLHSAQEFQTLFMTQIPQNGGKMLAGGAAIFIITLYIISSAYWFAPGLVYFYRKNPFEAVALSLAAGVRNLPAMLVFGVLALVMMVALSIVSAALVHIIGLPRQAGSLLLMAAVIPTFVTVIYCSFQDIFGVPE